MGFVFLMNFLKILPYLENTLKLDEKYESSNFGFGVLLTPFCRVANNFYFVAY
jgi:hypothetical protein